MGGAALKVFEYSLSTAVAADWGHTASLPTADGAEFDLVLELPGNCCVRATLVPRSGSSKVAEPVPERTINLGWLSEICRQQAALIGSGDFKLNERTTCCQIWSWRPFFCLNGTLLLPISGSSILSDVSVLKSALLTVAAASQARDSQSITLI